MRTRFTGITDQGKDQRKLIRMEAYRALLSLKEEPPLWTYSELKFHNDDEVIADYIVSDDDPRVMVRFYNNSKMEFIYQRHGIGCAFVVTTQDWAQWLWEWLMENVVN